MVNNLKKSKSILFFCKNNHGLGHLHRTLAIINGIKDLNTKITLIVYGRSYNFHRKNLEIFNINPNSKIEYIKNSFEIILLNTKPDIVVIEAFPFDELGIEEAIIFFLNSIKSNFPNTKLISSIGAYLGNEISFKKNRFMEKLNYCLRYYFDKVLVHTDPNFFKVDKEFKIDSDLKNKLVYTGFVSNKSKNELLSKKSVLSSIKKYDNNKKLILVHVGAGNDACELLSLVIQASFYLPSNYLFLISTGIIINEKDYNYLNNLIRKQKNILLTKHNPNLIDYLNCSNLSINMGGYNSIMDILVTGVPSITVPRYKKEDNKIILNNEQLIRCKTFKKAGFIDVLMPNELSVTNLVKKIKQNIDKKIKIKDIDINGRDKSAKILLSIKIN